MSNYNLPLTVQNGDSLLKIRDKCDYRVVLECIEAIKDNDLTDEEKAQCALIIFYENYEDITDPQSAIDEMMKIIGYDEEPNQQQTDKPALMDWEHDFKQIAPPISRTLGYSVRDPQKWTHWYDFVGAYMEIGECTFSNIITIRSKKQKGKPLEKWEQEFYRENKKLVDLPQNLTEEEKEWLDSDW